MSTVALLCHDNKLMFQSNRITQTVGVLLAMLLVPMAHATEDRTDFRPQWTVGDTWKVQSYSPADQQRGVRIPQSCWQFEVLQEVKLAGQACFRVRVRRLDDRDDSSAFEFFVAVDSMTLAAAKTPIRLAGRIQWIQESFNTVAGQPAPAAASSTTLPISLPLFQSATKDSGVFSYETGATAKHQKSAGAVRFRHQIRQRIEQTSRDELTVLIEGNRAIRQTWRRGLPWPLTTTVDGVTVRLMLNSDTSGE